MSYSDALSKLILTIALKVESKVCLPIFVNIFVKRIFVLVRTENCHYFDSGDYAY